MVSFRNVCNDCKLWNPEMFEQGMNWNSMPPQCLSSHCTDKRVKPKTRNESVVWDHQWEDEWSANYNTNKNPLNIIHERPTASNYPSLHSSILCQAVIQISTFISRLPISSGLNIAVVNNLRIRGHMCATQSHTQLALERARVYVILHKHSLC